MLHVVDMASYDLPWFSMNYSICLAWPALVYYALLYEKYYGDNFRWNCLDMIIVVLSIGGIILDELATSNFPMNPTIIRVMRVLRITRGNYHTSVTCFLQVFHKSVTYLSYFCHIFVICV